MLGSVRLSALIVVFATLLCAPRSQAAPPTKQAELDFFEAKIRPILVEHCYECHGSEKPAKGGLRLDSRDGWTLGGDSGPAILPGKPDESPLVQAVRYDPSFVQMPPKGRLSEQAVHDLEAWVTRGAADPRTAPMTTNAKKAVFDLQAARQWWAYRLPSRVPEPAVHNTSWSVGSIDRFVLARLEAAGLKSAGDAPPRTLVRRLYFDLVGLPPSPEEVQAFASDSSSSAYEALVDRLLVSPQFGERWGRHWLDVVRYGESLTLRGFVLDSAWRYRDYVIDTFNADRPYDQFVREQVAGDLLAAGDVAARQRQRVAVAFLALGNTNLEEQDKNQLRMDVVDEQLDTLGKAFLGQTLGCARCHDHKFDPIPTRDYYALAGILRNTRTLLNANVSKWIEAPLPLEPADEVVYSQHERQMTSLESGVNQARIALKRMLAAADDKADRERPDVLALADLPGVVVDDAQAKVVGQWQASKFTHRYIGAGYLHDDNREKGRKTLTFVPDFQSAGKYEVRLAYSQHTNRATNVPVTIFSAAGEQTVRINMREEPDIDGRFVSLGVFPFEANGQGFVLISTEGTDGVVAPDAVQFLSAESTESLLKLAQAKAKQAKADAPADAMQQAVDRLKGLEKELTEARRQGPKRPMVVGVDEQREIGDTRVHVRGSVHNLGESVPRGFLQAAAYNPPPTLPSNESGRRELAEWLASPQNPLTARVMANRCWHWLMGAGLVRTTDNFGRAGELPSHPELLDELAVQFVAEGWSVKRLVRQIVLSHAYRQAASAERQTLAKDPENRLLGHMNRRRLEAECIRDAMLVVSGQLDRSAGGSTIPSGTTSDYNYKQQSNRRSVYLPVFRNTLPELFEVFDFADPSMPSGRRNVSTVAPQALFLMNHPFVVEQSRLAAKRLLSDAHPGSEDAAAGNHAGDSNLVTQAFERSWGRPPTSRERKQTEDYMASLRSGSRPVSAEEAWKRVFQSLFASIDFRYIE